MENWKYKRLQEFVAEELVPAAGGNSHFTTIEEDFPKMAIELDMGRGIKLSTTFSSDSNEKTILYILNGIKDIVNRWNTSK